MKVSLLFLSVLALIQLISGYETPEGVELWRPSIEKLSSIIHICEHKLSLESIHARTLLLNRGANLKVNTNIDVQLSKLGTLPFGGVLRPSVSVNKNLDVNLGGLGAVSVQKSIDVDKKIGLLPIGRVLRPSVSVNKNLDVNLGGLGAVSVQKSIDVDKKLGLLPIGGVLRPSVSVDKNLDVNLGRLGAVSVQKSIDVDKKLGLLPIGGVLRPSVSVDKNIDVKLGRVGGSLQQSLDVNKKQDARIPFLPFRLPSIVAVTRSPQINPNANILSAKSDPLLTILRLPNSENAGNNPNPFAGANTNANVPSSGSLADLAFKLIEGNAKNQLAGNTKPKLFVENSPNRGLFSVIPINVFGRKDDQYVRPAAPPISNVVTINNENKQDDRLLSRTQPVDIIIGHKGVKNLNNAHDDTVSLSPRTRLLSKKQKYKRIAACVNSRLLKAYEEEMAFYD